MGKRKYVSEENNVSKDSGNDETEDKNSDENVEQTPNTTETENKSKKPRKGGGFDIKYFRKELTAKQGQTMGKTDSSIHF